MFISQIPNILKQKFLKAKQKVDEVANVGVTNSLIQHVSKVRHMAVGNVGGHKTDKVSKHKSKNQDAAKEGEVVG